MIVPKLFNIALIFCKRYSIDESHAIGHAMNVLHYSHDIMKHEALTRPDIVKHKNIIYAFGHHHLGWTLGAVTGKIVSGMVAEENTNLDLSPYSSKRFS